MWPNDPRGQDLSLSESCRACYLIWQPFSSGPLDTRHGMILGLSPRRMHSRLSYGFALLLRCYFRHICRRAQWPFLGLTMRVDFACPLYYPCQLIGILQLILEDTRLVLPLVVMLLFPNLLHLPPLRLEGLTVRRLKGNAVKSASILATCF